MPCEECGCRVMDYYAAVSLIEKYQTLISDLYEKKPFPKDEVRRLKIKRDTLMKRVWSELEEIGYWIRREVLRDRNIPIDWRNGEYETSQEYAQATDWEESSDDTEQPTSSHALPANGWLSVDAVPTLAFATAAAMFTLLLYDLFAQ